MNFLWYYKYNVCTINSDYCGISKQFSDNVIVLSQFNETQTALIKKQDFQPLLQTSWFLMKFTVRAGQEILRFFPLCMFNLKEGATKGMLIFRPAYWHHWGIQDSSESGRRWLTPKRERQTILKKIAFPTPPSIRKFIWRKSMRNPERYCHFQSMMMDFVLPRFIFRVLSASGGGMLGLGLLLFVGLTSCLHSQHEVRRRHEDWKRKQEKRRCSVNNIRKLFHTLNVLISLHLPRRLLTGPQVVL